MIRCTVIHPSPHRAHVEIDGVRIPVDTDHSKRPQLRATAILATKRSATSDTKPRACGARINFEIQPARPRKWKSVEVGRTRHTPSRMGTLARRDGGRRALR